MTTVPENAMLDFIMLASCSKLEHSCLVRLGGMGLINLATNYIHTFSVFVCLTAPVVALKNAQ